MMRRRTFLSAAALSPLALQAQRIEPLQGRELFVDRYWIDKLENATLRLQTPLDRGTVLKFDRPWEGAFSGYSTILRLENGFRMYYRGIPKSGADGRMEEVTCYAESKDGIHFTKPADNIILKEQPPFSHNFAPFLDRRPGVPESERFKAIAGTAHSGLAAFASADGIKWRKMREEPIQAATKLARYDSQNLAFWSTSEKRYVLYCRSFKEVAPKRRVRWIARATSDDFLHWTEPTEMRFVTGPDLHDAPPEHLYTNQTSPYYRAPHIYVSIAARFLPGRQVLTPEEASAIHVDPDYFKDCSDAILMSTRGGLNYNRTFLESFLRPGLGMENWVSRTNYPALNVVQTSPSEISFYANRNYGQPTALLTRYTLRIDGFASLHAGYDGGEMTTRPFVSNGTKLEINFSTSAAGSVFIEVQDESGAPIPGYALADSRELIGDQIDRQVAWKSGAQIGALKNKPIRLRFKLKDADVFSWAIV